MNTYERRASEGKCLHCEEKPAKGRKSCQFHLDYAKSYSKTRTKSQIEKRNARQRDTNFQTRVEALERYGGCCTCCGETLFELLTLDHIDKSGAKFRKEFGSGSLAPKLKRMGWPNNIRVLCWNCNAAIGMYGKCPHGTFDE